MIYLGVFCVVHVCKLGETSFKRKHAYRILQCKYVVHCAGGEPSYVMHNNLDYSADVCSRGNLLCVVHLDALYLLLLCVVWCVQLGKPIIVHFVQSTLCCASFCAVEETSYKSKHAYCTLHWTMLLLCAVLSVQ